MAALSFFFGILGNVISILVFASPMKTFWEVVKRKSTEDFKVAPYMTTLLSTSLWTFYGILKPGGLLVFTVNAAGAFLQLIYVILFLIFAPRAKKIRTAKLAAVFNVGFLGAVMAVTLLAMHRTKLRLTFVGIICAALTIGMYASPLSVMRLVIRTKSVEYMPFWLSFFLFLNASVWSIYSFLVRDIYIGIPNALGFVLGTVQLILYFIYNNKSQSTEPADDVSDDDSSAQPVKEGIEMNSSYNNGKNLENKSLHNLSKPSVDQEYNLQVKSHSYEVYATDYSDETDVERGHVDHR